MTKNLANKENETFSGNFAIFFATLGSAVGLGNIWKFPYVTGENGGAAFLLVYLGCVVLVGLPILIAEYALGRHTRANVVTAYETMGNHSVWKIPGFLGVASSFLILFFYTTVAGWTYYYFIQSLLGGFQNLTASNAQEVFSDLTAGTMMPLLFQALVVIGTTIIICLGVRRGIEGLTKRLIPLLLVLLLLCVFQSLQLPNSWAGVKFLFVADFSKLTSNSILIALGLAFFKLSLGLGSMITYASYFHKGSNIMRNAVQVVVADTVVSMLAGLAIFPAVFSFGMTPGSGPGLLFMTIPLIFSQMPFGNILTSAFFFLSASAATMAIISMVEVPVAYLIGTWKMRRVSATITVSLVILTVGSLAALSATPKSVLGDIHIFGRTFFDLFDFLSSNFAMPLGGLCCAILMGWRVKKALFKDEITNYGELKMDQRWSVYLFILRYVSPLLVLVIFLNALGVI